MVLRKAEGWQHEMIYKDAETEFSSLQLDKNKARFSFKTALI